ncbi:MAG: hypothetical protein CMJ48_12510 [Planctomycetaceae bacterium]|nr:hypothetical protein [Planctomycetaceae bacterium]
MKTLESPTEVGHGADAPEASLPLEGRRVLLVEDSPDQQRLYFMFLRRAGADVTLECNGRAALHAVEKSAGAFDAVVMDLKMPGMDGIEATAELRSNGFNNPIVAVTANGRAGTEQLWLQAGCNVYLEKPLNESTLIDTIRQHLIPR